MKLILHSDDMNLLIYWEEICSNYIVVDDIEWLNNYIDSVIVINLSAFNSKQKEIISSLSKSGNLLLVLDRIPNIKTAKELLSYGAKGYGNALMKGHFILSAIETMKDEMIWLHPEITSQLITQIADTKEKDISSFLEKLSTREQEVAKLLKDADTYKVIAEKLNITPRTVKAHTQKIYKKLEVKDRLALALLLK